MYTSNVTASMQALWVRFLDIVPQLLGAVLTLIIGIVLAIVVAAVVRRVLRFTGIDAWVAKAGLNQRLNIRDGSAYALVSNLVASIVKWVIILGTIGVAADVLQLTGVRAFIGAILAYIPNVIVAILILTIGVIASQIVAEVVGVGESALDVSSSTRRVLTSVARYAIIIFAAMAALIQLNIVPQLIEIAFAGLVFALALSFGLGGREHASQWISDLKRQA
jgi:hypothetical protein